MKKQSRARKVLIRFIAKYDIWWYGITAFLYFLAIPITVWVFPATTLLLTVFVLFGGFTASMASFASALIDVEESDEVE